MDNYGRRMSVTERLHIFLSFQPYTGLTLHIRSSWRRAHLHVSIHDPAGGCRIVLGWPNSGHDFMAPTALGGVPARPSLD